MPEHWRPGGLESFLAEPVESYIMPIVADIALRSEVARARAPRELAAALGARYTIDSVIGVGGMATVFLAHDHSFGRAVAVKVLHRALADSLGAERFVQEIELTARLEHSRIVPVHERGEADGVLYFVMRYFEGGSLRQYIEHHGQLPIPTAIRLAHDVAQAIDHAHARGVVHRDIKPANILLEGLSAFVADFGIARLVDVAGAKHLTETGVVIGTPEYMSPEQAEPGGKVDGRSDVYSLGCVLYEMLAGEPPYTAPSRRDVLAKHASAAIPDLSILRSTVTPAMRRVVEKALQKSPADRFATCGEFIEAFDKATHEAPARPRPHWVPHWIDGRVASLAAAAVVLTAAGATAANTGALSGMFATLDSTSVAVLPFVYDSSFTGKLQERQLVGDAFRRWRGVSVVDEVRLTEKVADRDASVVSKDARPIARGLGAGRFVRGEVSQVGDSVRIHAALYDTRGDRFIREGTVRVAGTLAALDSAGADLVAQLWFAPTDRVARTECLKTALPDAYRACTAGHEAISKGNLAGADSAFALAGTLDADFTHAHLWLAQVRSWRIEPVARWSSAAERAASGAGLGATEQIRAKALATYTRGDIRASCQLWGDLVELSPGDYSALYSLATCLRSDVIVVRDSRSPSGWRFRSSWHRAVGAYKRAFDLRPSLFIAFKANLFAEVRAIFMTAGAMRFGRSEGPMPQRFLGQPGWQGDSLVFIPYPENWVREARPETRSATRSEAIRNQRRIFAALATTWATADSSSEALEAQAVALELLGEAGANVALHRARSLALTATDSLRIGAHEVWLQLKQAIPGDDVGIMKARSLADSLLRRGMALELDATAQAALAGLAALTGRASVAGELSAAAGSAVERAGGRLVAFAALGGPTDTLRRLERQLAGLIERGVAKEQAPLRQQWLERAASLAFPDIAADAPYLPKGEDPLLDAERDLLRGDIAGARAYLSARKRGRALVDPALLSYDGIYPEAAMLVRLGDEAGAIAWLDPVLGALSSTAPMAVGSAPAAGAFVRAMALRADLASRAGDRDGARQWARAVSILWSNADGFLQPIYLRAKSLNP